MIVSDDAGYNAFGFNSALTSQPTNFQTPNLDALAFQSVVARQGYVASPVCSPSRAGYITGMNGLRFGYETNVGSSLYNFGLSPNETTIAQRLRDLGYSTGMIGKWHLGFTDGYNRPQDMGFDEFYGFLGGNRSYWLQPTNPDNMLRRGDTLIENQWRTEGDPSKYDPVNGRYLTDAFGEEAVDFINRHANESNPFFLNIAFTAPHTPLQAKQVDLDHFSHIANSDEQKLAAMVYAMDRSIGEVLEAVSAQGIDDNTIVAFVNDNGGPLHSGNPYNHPFRGHKGTTFEGGIRVPFLIHAPGLAPGVYDPPITTLDIVPTFLAAAGGDPSQLETDGVDLMPFLTGGETANPHEILYWRASEPWAVRKGDWKLVLPFDGTFARLYNLATDPLEATNLTTTGQPQIAADLYRELTAWEAQLEKMRWGSAGANDRNNFDEFVFASSVATGGNWSAAGTWKPFGAANSVTMNTTDAYANAVLEFNTSDSSYTATNDMLRLSTRTFMLNQLRLAGVFTSVSNQTGTINGNSLLLVESLAGEMPKIRLDATSSVTPANFAFEVANELQLFDDLEITGNGTQQFLISGPIRDYYESLDPTVTTPHNVTKTGTSQVTLSATNTFGGTLTVNGGTVTLGGPSAAINGAAAIVVGNTATLTVDSGLIATPSLTIADGGQFQFNGGTLKVVNVTGDLVNDGGTYSPGASPALSAIHGDFTQNEGTLEIELGGTVAGTQFDKLVVDGLTTLDGVLDVRLINGFSPTAGQVFQFLTANGGLTGEFSDILLPTLSGGLQWLAAATETGFLLRVGTQGDYNHDGTVNAADYVVWRKTLGDVGAGLAADGNGNRIIDVGDYTIWLGRLGQGVASATVSDASVPEPSAVALSILGLLAGTIVRRRNHVRSS